MFKIAVISDIHSNLQALSRVVGLLGGVDLVVFAGDIVGYGGSPREVIVELRKLKPLKTVLGNHDYACIHRDFSFFNDLAIAALNWTVRTLREEDLEYISGIPLKEVFDAGGYRIYVTHGSPFNNLYDYVYFYDDADWRRFFEYTCSDIIILGHTHIPMMISNDDKYIINPGSVGQPRDGRPSASYCILTISGKVSVEFKRVDYDIDESAKAILDNGLPEFLAKRLYRGI